MKTSLSCLRHCSSAGAFTLTEIALAIAIVSIGLLAVVGVLPSLLTTNRQAIDANEVALLAQDLVEYDYSFKYNPADIDGLSGFNTNITSSTKSFSVSNKVSYVVSTNVIANAAFKDCTGTNVLKTVRIKYCWPPGADKPMTYTFITEVAATRDIPMD